MLAARIAEQTAAFDAILMPTAPRQPTIAEVAADPIGENARLGVYTNFCNLLDLCAVAVPVGVTDDGAQFGVTVFASAGHDAVALDLACAVASASAPAAAWNAASVGATELAVFGAHLRGQPLEHELTDLGARWNGAVRTAPGYRLRALDTVPLKPGLVRDRRGIAVRGETWLVTPSMLGRFLTELPAPMTLGAVDLDDGRTVVGFSCEPSAAADGRVLPVDSWLDRDTGGVDGGRIGDAVRSAIIAWAGRSIHKLL